MLGLDLARDYYNQIIRPLIAKHFPQLRDNHAAALIGWGSDVLANDDELSQDHEWGPRCLLFLPEALSNLGNELFNLFNAEIPSHFMGYPTKFTVVKYPGLFRLPSREGAGLVNIDITTCHKYFLENLGVVTPNDDIEWLSIPESKSLEITRGEVFFDGPGELTAFREFYQAYYPLNVWKYRLSYAWQSLAWNVDLIGLCNARSDLLSARNCLSLVLFKIMKLTFLLNRKYATSYPKWLGKEFYRLPALANNIGPILESCYLETDIKSVIAKLEAICKVLIEHQNNYQQLPKIDIAPCPWARGFWKIDLQHIAEQIFGTITGPLGKISLAGAIDQWITNEDFMVDTNNLKLLSAVYRQKNN